MSRMAPEGRLEPEGRREPEALGKKFGKHLDSRGKRELEGRKKLDNHMPEANGNYEPKANYKRGS